MINPDHHNCFIIAVKEEDFCPVDPEERIPFEETDTDYKQLQLNMNQGIKGI